MSTRACIARKTGPTTFQGVYHHWDGYPTALGATLWSLYHGHFKRDLEKMLSLLIDEHPAGWSTINNADFKLPAAYQEAKYRKKRNGDNDYSKPIPHGPICYCHGGRHEEKKLMHVLERVYTDNAVSTGGANLGGKHMVGMFGCGAPGHQRWQDLAAVALDGPEPDWESLRSVQAATNLK
ncbi:MAG: hypothetical protein LAO03_21555 [Acidobacteriia bacterium]|nr:hypothetical protein [Terriglobia bacterium]